MIKFTPLYAVYICGFNILLIISGKLHSNIVGGGGVPPLLEKHIDTKVVASFLSQSIL